MTGGHSRREGIAMSTQGTILVVEDDAEIAALLVEFLTEEGYTVQHASNASDALAVFQTDGFELALVDTYLPGTSDWKLLEAVRAQQRDVPVVITTTSAVTPDELLAVGVRTCLYQPFDLDELLECVRQHIRPR
jgi:DNA-binding response OmpR family regulator